MKNNALNIRKRGKILFLGEFNYNTYTRGRILYKGLLKNNINAELFLRRCFLRYFKIMLRILKKDYDSLIINGKKVLIISRILTKKPIIFDMATSDYDTLVRNRKTIREGSLMSRIIWWGDKLSCMISDRVLLDTRTHVNWFCKEFSIKKDKFYVVRVGADEGLMIPEDKPDTKDNKNKERATKVIYFGTYIPLHGVEHILDAAEILKGKKNISFILAGYGQTFHDMKKIAENKNLTNVKFLKNTTFSTDLLKRINEADICMGIFEKNKTIEMVIPHKAFETIAMKKALITAESHAIKEVFTDKKDCLLVKAGDGKEIAKAIILLDKNRALLNKIKNNGYRLFKEKYTTEHIGKDLINAIDTTTLRRQKIKKTI